MISQIFILSARGDTLIVKDFRNDLTKSTPEIFYRIVKTSKNDPEPVFNKDGINFVFIRSTSLYVVLTSRFNIQATVAVDFLNVLVKNYLCLQISIYNSRKLDVHRRRKRQGPIEAFPVGNGIFGDAT